MLDPSSPVFGFSLFVKNKDLTPEPRRAICYARYTVRYLSLRSGKSAFGEIGATPEFLTKGWTPPGGSQDQFGTAFGACIALAVSPIWVAEEK
jgi:hypothetical protein